MTKRILIVADTFVPSGDPTQPQRPAYADSVLEVDDNTAGLLKAAGKAVEAKKDAKLVDMTKEREAAAAVKAKRASTPEQALAAIVATAVQAALAGTKAAPAA